MHVEITYPSVKKKYSFERRKLLGILRWPYIGVGIAAVIVNLCVRGPLWSVLVILSLYISWRLFLSLDLVEYNRLSQSIKGVYWTCVLLLLIDWLIVPIWASFVVPIVGAGGLILCGTLFFTDLETQKHNMLPLLLFLFVALIAAGIGVFVASPRDFWSFLGLGIVAVLLLVSLIVILRRDLVIEMRRRFHIK